MDLDIDEKLPELKLSPLQEKRLDYQPPIPDSLQNLSMLDFAETDFVKCDPALRQMFAYSLHRKAITLTRSEAPVKPINVGVVLSGGQAAGGHNVLSGLFDAMQELHPASQLIGFLNGPGGIVRNRFTEITKELLVNYRNQGGFDIIGSGRTKIETQEQFRAAMHAVNEQELDGLVIVGGDDSNTNAAFLSEYFAVSGCKTCVVGVPKTIDGDLQSDQIEISFGFDTACKTYSETIGNICRDCLSAKKYYYFIKLMGRSASHITLECALQCQPNLALIGEEIKAKNFKLQDVVMQIVDLVRDRARQGREYGVILVPEGIVEFMPDFRALIFALNALLPHGSKHIAELERRFEPQEKIDYVAALLQPDVRPIFRQLPYQIQLQLLIDRDPHGNVQVSKIDSERLLIMLAEAQLKHLDPSIKFSAQPIFCGYEGRSCLPSNFDATYCYSLGRLSALLIARRRSGYIVSMGKLALPVEFWEPRATAIVSMMTQEVREGKQKAVVRKALVELASRAFVEFSKKRASWRLLDQYCQPGPIQYFGPSEITDSVPITLKLNRRG